MKTRHLAITLVLTCLTACNGGAGGITAGMAESESGAGGTSIASVQGAGPGSPLDGQQVTVSGIVSGDFQNGDANSSSDLGGFFMQSESPDNDPDTSDGIFVFDAGDSSIDVDVGDRVTVTGTVQEYFGETQIVANSIAVKGSGSVRATDVSLPTASVATNSDGDWIADLEAFEGMLVRFSQPLIVSEVRDLERFGSMLLAEGGRLFQYTNQNLPDVDGYRAHRTGNAARSIVLDDGQRSNNVSPIRYLGAADGQLRIGDTVSGLTGNLRYSRGSGGSGDEAWRVMPTSDPEFDKTNPRPALPDAAGSLRIASFNVLNYFSTIDSGNDRCGPARNENCRGADSDDERRRQLQKITTALAMIDADIVGLVELENNASESLSDIVDALNGRVGTDAYEFVDTGRIGDDVIKTGFIFKPATVIPTGRFAILGSNVDPSFNDERNRPALAQSFSQRSDGAAITVVVNHLKSKGSDCEAEGDPNIGDGQGNCNRTRSLAAAAIADWLDGDPTSSGDADFLIIGDLNAYLEEDPLATLKAAGYSNLIEIVGGRDAYSFVFDGQSGALDHALASPSLGQQVVAAIEWHINADEPRALDYNLEHGRDPGLFDGDTPYRTSDHDPVIIDIKLN